MTQDKVRLNDGTVLLNVHTQDVCEGQHCCIHNPSQHHMLQWPGHWEPLFKQMWRTCPHGAEHPDPDDLAFHRAKFGDDATSVSSLHGCDGCCQPPPAPRGKTIDEWMAETTPVDLNSLPAHAAQPILDFLEHPETGTVAARPDRGGTLVAHDPVWQSTMLRVNAAGDERPGFECVHELENGSGPCGATVFYVEDAIGRHTCWVPEQGQP